MFRHKDIAQSLVCQSTMNREKPTKSLNTIQCNAVVCLSVCIAILAFIMVTIRHILMKLYLVDMLEV